MVVLKKKSTVTLVSGVLTEEIILELLPLKTPDDPTATVVRLATEAVLLI